MAPLIVRFTHCICLFSSVSPSYDSVTASNFQLWTIVLIDAIDYRTIDFLRYRPDPNNNNNNNIDVGIMAVGAQTVQCHVGCESVAHAPATSYVSQNALHAGSAAAAASARKTTKYSTMMMMMMMMCNDLMCT